MREFIPHKYQLTAINHVINVPKCGLFLDMGLGKTVSTLTAIKELKYNRFQVNKVLIIAPKKVAEGTWSKEKDKWNHTKDFRVSLVLGSQQKRIKALSVNADLYIINRENIPWLVDYLRNDWYFDTVVIDESSSFKNSRSKRFKALKMVLPKINRLIELTGTPSPNGVEDLWAQIYLLDQGTRLEKYITHFRAKYMEPNKRNRSQIFDYKIKDGVYDSIINKISDICISMKSEDYLELPDLSYNEIPVILNDKARRDYDKMERDFVLELEGAEDEITAVNAAALSNKLLQISNGAVYDSSGVYTEVHDAKIDSFLELVERLQGKSLLVFYNFQHDRDRIKKALEKSDLVVKELKTTQDEDDWNAGKIDILLTHPASAAYGLNLQEGGNHVCWFGLSWNLEHYQQANKRLHRQGQKEKVIIHHLVTQGTRDEDVMRALDNKAGVQEEIMQSLKARIKKVKEGVK
nr:MAG TPA: Helicase of the snf2 rad54 family [Caudoviricetes sp.]